MSEADEYLAIIKIKVQQHFHLTDEQFEDMFEKSRFIEMKAGATLFKEGTHNDNVYIVADGEARVVKNDEVINTVGRGDILGEMSLVGVDKSSATVIAETPMTLFKFKKTIFEILLNRYPDMNQAIVMETINRRIQQGEVDV